MGLCLIASGWLDGALWLAVLEVAIGLGMVIFVHELGHFAVAKACGVKCEKFYLGFDIAGLKLCKFRWGETEYGIGILPLGGYVKMLGQEDNPARLRAEIERARQKQEAEQAAESPPESPAAEAGPAVAVENGPQDAQTDQPEEAEDNPKDADAEPSKPEPIDVEAAERALYDPRSYLAQSVPKRMAIISAGVIMNLIFAFVIAAFAFGLGVTRNQCVVGQMMPGKTAWKQGIQVGDQFTEVGGKKIGKFRDMQEAVSLGDDIDEGILIKAIRPDPQRPDSKTEKTFKVLPDKKGLLPIIGVFHSATTTFWDKEFAVRPGSAAAGAEPAIQPGDKVVKIDKTPIETFAQIHAYLARHPDKPLALTVERLPDKPIMVPPRPMRRLGLVMTMGKITAVQAGSPAAKAGIRAGDLVRQIDGEPAGDPMTLPDRLRQRPGQTVTVTVERIVDKKKLPVDLPVVLRQTDSYEIPIDEGAPVTVPAMGIAYSVLNKISSVDPGSPAAAVGIRAGDVVIEGTLLPPDKQTAEEEKLEQSELTIEFEEEARNWPAFFYALQGSLPDTKVRLTCVRKERTSSATLAATVQPVPSETWFNPERGFLFQPLTFIEQAGGVGDAIRLGAEETIHATLLVYRFLQKLTSQQVSPKALGGPVSIFVVAKHYAEQGLSELLIFLTLLSANLAVINFLPIPLLDGGHMVLLAWEGIRGKPADERVQLLLTYLGLFFILGLMAWVIGLDITRLVSR